MAKLLIWDLELSKIIFSEDVINEGVCFGKTVQLPDHGGSMTCDIFGVVRDPEGNWNMSLMWTVDE